MCFGAAGTERDPHLGESLSPSGGISGYAYFGVPAAGTGGGSPPEPLAHDQKLHQLHQVGVPAGGRDGIGATGRHQVGGVP